MMPGNLTKKTDPFLNILAAGIKLWLLARCNRVSDLTIELQGSFLQYLRGNISEIYLKANQIDFQGLLINNVNIRTSPIKIIFSRSKDRSVEIENPFDINGHLSFSEKDLKGILFSEQWMLLNHRISNQLFDDCLLIDLKIVDDKLYFYVSNSEELTVAIDIYAASGNLFLKLSNGQKKIQLPMDSNINIERAFVSNNELYLYGEALVKP